MLRLIPGMPSGAAGIDAGSAMNFVDLQGGSWCCLPVEASELANS
jgi:hypothetical protein